MSRAELSETRYREYVHRELAALGDAPRQALARRTPAFFASLDRRPWAMAWTVLVSMGGLFLFDWSPASLWVFILLGLWGNVLENALKLLLFFGAVQRWYAIHAQDQEVWGITGALMRRQDTGRARVPEKHSKPLGLWLIDLTLLAVASAMIGLIAADRDIDLLGEFWRHPTLVWVTAGTTGVQALLALWQDRWRDDHGRTTLRFEPMGPAIIGWFLMFLFAAVAQSQDALFWLILVVNALIAVGIPLMVLARRVYREETQWLSATLDELEAQPVSSPFDAMANPDGS